MVFTFLRIENVTFKDEKAPELKTCMAAMASLIYQVYSGILLTLLHVVNIQLCRHFVRPKLLPLLFSTSETRLVNSINGYLKLHKSSYEIPVEKTRALFPEPGWTNAKETYALRHLPMNVFNHIGMINITFDLITSFSFQLIGLFLLDIVNCTDFIVKHFDWYLTLSVLIVGLVYLIPTYLLYLWISTENKWHITRSRNIFNCGVIFIIWSTILYALYSVTITKDVDGNILQISLYLLSLFGVSCLSILNGTGCILGCYDLWNWFKGKDETDLQKKEMELSADLRNFDSLLQKSDSKDHIWNSLIKIESALRDINSARQSQKGFYFFIKGSTWIYCLYKVMFGIMRTIQLVCYAIGFIQNVIEKKGNANSDDFYTGSGDLLSSTIAKLVVIFVYNDNKSLSTTKEILENYPEKLDQITMIIKFFISVTFFLFSFQNVLLTFKNFKVLSRKLIGLSHFEVFNVIQREFVNILEFPDENNFPNGANTLFQELTSVCICEMAGIYILSTAFLLNSTNMPIHLSKLFITQDVWNNEILAVKNYTIDADFVNEWFDKWFAFGCFSTVIIYMLLEKLESNAFNGSYSVFDEEQSVQ